MRDWKPQRVIALILCLVSTSCFIISLCLPISVIDYDVDDLSAIKSIHKWTDNPCQVFDGFPSAITVTCKATLNSYSHSTRNRLLDHTLGPIGNQTWEECIEEDQGQSLARISDEIKIPEDHLNKCFKVWMHKSLGVPLGDSSLLKVILDLFGKGDYLLGLMLSIFTLCFPLIKLGINFFMLLTPSKELALKLHAPLEQLGRWSMADVFVVSMLVVIVKFDSLGLQIRVLEGLYYFAASTILSMLATWRLGFYLHDQRHP